MGPLKKKTQFHRNRDYNRGCQGLSGRGDVVIYVKGYKLSVKRWIISKDSMYSLVTMVNNMVLYT